MGPLQDADLPDLWQRLGIPGVLDVHVHFMPDPVMRKVWAFFDDESHYGRPWPISYRLPELQRLEVLRGFGLRGFPSLVYPHKPGMAAWLNDWAHEFARHVPDVWETFTLYPEPGVHDYVATALDQGARIGKVHLQVGAFDPRDPLLDEVWGTLADRAVPVIVHCGSGPVPGRFTGPGPFGEVLERHPRLVAVIAHLGMPDYDAFCDLVSGTELACLDTTMAFTDFAQRGAPVSADLRARMADLEDRVLFGSDFPNIPHSYAHAVDALLGLELGDDWLRAVFWDNAERVLGVPGPGNKDSGPVG